MANHAGSHDSISFFGRSQVISPQGEIVAEASRADVGTTPTAETLIVEIARNPEPREAIESDVLFSQLRPDLAVASFRSDEPLIDPPGMPRRPTAPSQLTPATT